MWQMLVKPVADLFSKGLDIIDDMVPDKDLAAKLKATLHQRIIDIANNEFLAVLKAQASIIMSETQGHWLQRNWRPMLMCLFGIIIANNYIVYPYLALFFSKAPKMGIPPDMWSLLKIGLGGYVVGRSGEKIASVWKRE